MKKTTDDATAGGGGEDGFSHKPELKFTQDDKIELIKPYSIIDEIKKMKSNAIDDIYHMLVIPNFICCTII